MAKVEIPIQVTIPVEDLVEYLKKDGTLVEVVRCKECKYWNENMNMCERLQMVMFNSADWFCADGERRE